MKIITYSLLLTLLFCVTITTPIYAKEIGELNLADGAKSVMLIEQDTGEVLFQKDSFKQLPPASMTKIMTLLLIMDSLEKGELTLEETITISARAASMGGSQIFLSEGEEMSVQNLIKGIAIASGNDASVAMAERIAGSEEAFAEQMNEKAKELQLKDTHFVNASGLPAENHYSTAHDMAMMSKELLKYESITDYTSVYEDYLRKGEENEFWLVNTNKLVRFYPNVDGLKTGFTSEAKYCLAATAKNDNMRVIAVVMGAETAKERNAQVMQLINYAFANYQTEKIFAKGETVAEIRNLQSEKLFYEVKTSEPLSVIHKKTEQDKAEITNEIELKSIANFPIKQGTEIGTITLKKQDEIVSESPLIVEEEIVVASFFTLFQRTLKHIVKYDDL